MKYSSIAALPLSLILASACGGESDPDPSGTSDDDMADAGGDLEPGLDPSALVLFIERDNVPCDWQFDPTGQPVEVCPPEHNQDVFRVTVDAETGEVAEIALAETNDGQVRPEDGRSPDDDVFLGTSPDRSWVYYSNAVGGTLDIYRVAISGQGEAELLTDESVNDWFVGVDPGGDLWVVSDRSGDRRLYLIPADGQGEAQEAAGSSEINAVYSITDSGPLIRVSGDDRVLSVDPNDLTVTPLLDTPASFAGMADDGATALVTRDIDDVRNLWAIPMGGGEPRQLTEHQGKTIYFMTVTSTGHVLYEHRPDTKKQVFSVPLDGSEPPRQLTMPSSGESSYYRVLSEDHSRMIFTSNDRPGGFGDTEMYEVPVTGGDAVLLTDFENESYFMPFAYSEQHGLLYNSPLDGDIDIYKRSADGTIVNLSDNEPWADKEAMVTPDGRFVFFYNFSDDPVYMPNGQLSPETDRDIFAVDVANPEHRFQVTDNLVVDSLVGMVSPMSVERRDQEQEKSALDHLRYRPQTAGDPAALR